jgi:hypothetical protein
MMKVKPLVEAKVTTADCKEFLAQTFTDKPEIITELWGDETAVGHAQDPKLWVRVFKSNPMSTKSDYYLEAYPLHEGGEIEGSKLAAVRMFVLDPHYFDSAIQFMVLEGKDGKLYLGEEMGD